MSETGIWADFTGRECKNRYGNCFFRKKVDGGHEGSCDCYSEKKPQEISKISSTDTDYYSFREKINEIIDKLNSL